jgi:hypothetical protein
MQWWKAGYIQRGDDFRFDGPFGWILASIQRDGAFKSPHPPVLKSHTLNGTVETWVYASVPGGRSTRSGGVGATTRIGVTQACRQVRTTPTPTSSAGTSAT